MALYEFNCRSCEKSYEILTPYDETGKYSKVKCPHCKSKKKQKLLSTFDFSFANPIGTDRWNASHGYRFENKIPQAVAEREKAKKMSHMGQTPYTDIDDISKGDKFGEVK